MLEALQLVYLRPKKEFRSCSSALVLQIKTRWFRQTLKIVSEQILAVAWAIKRGLPSSFPHRMVPVALQRREAPWSTQCQSWVETASETTATKAENSPQAQWKRLPRPRPNHHSLTTLKRRWRESWSIQVQSIAPRLQVQNRAQAIKLVKARLLARQLNPTKRSVSSGWTTQSRFRDPFLIVQQMKMSTVTSRSKSQSRQ